MCIILGILQTVADSLKVELNFQLTLRHHGGSLLCWLVFDCSLSCLVDCNLRKTRIPNHGGLFRFYWDLGFPFTWGHFIMKQCWCYCKQWKNLMREEDSVSFDREKWPTSSLNSVMWVQVMFRMRERLKNGSSTNKNGEALSVYEIMKGLKTML